MQMISTIVKLYNKADDLADPYVKKWFLMNTAWFPILTTMFYLYFVLRLGPRLMKNRQPFDIKKLIIFYNIAQVVFNAYLFLLTCNLLFNNIHSFRCFPSPRGDTADGLLQRRGNWLFMLNKLMDLLDTIFFVVKKKQSHVTFLHVYHHVLTFTGCWFMAKYMPGGQLIVIGVLNSLVHCVMYSYYLFSLFDQCKKLTAFVKQHITQMQIVQFFIAGIHASFGATDPTCNYPTALLIFGISQAIMLTVLFLNFYRKSYLNSHKMDHTPQNGYLKNGTAKKTQ